MKKQPESRWTWDDEEEPRAPSHNDGTLGGEQPPLMLRGKEGKREEKNKGHDHVLRSLACYYNYWVVRSHNERPAAEAERRPWHRPLAVWTLRKATASVC